MERTFGIIKPDAVEAKYSGRIISRIEEEGFNIVAMKKVHIAKDKAEEFYAVHKERPFYDELTTFLSSGPIIVMVLEKADAIKGWRNLMGATNPAEAEENTLRKLYARSLGENAVHGSDAPETAKQEIAFFFPELS